MNIWEYIQGDRKGKEAHRIEKEAMHDPFLADAIEGYENTPGNHLREVSRLQKKIENRKSGKPVGKTIRFFKIGAVAASILVIVGAGGWFMLNNNLPNEEEQNLFDKTEPVMLSRTMAKEAVTVQEEAVAVADQDSIAVDTTKPYPIVGMEAYMEYIQKELRHPTDNDCRNVKGSVVVQFKIGQSGRPYQIRVTHGICSSINQEAIRLIIDGPDWKAGSNTDEATLTITFK